MVDTLTAIRRELLACADARDARFLQRFFKTGAGEYAEGDRFRGIRVPELRRLALLILVAQFRAADPAGREAIVRTYLSHTRYINNWDLVDASAPQILGAADSAILSRLARSASLWERRIAIVSTLAGIRQGRFGATLRIAKLLLRDPHDLIHKAVGWMLRDAIEHFPEPRRRRYLRGEPG